MLPFYLPVFTGRKDNIQILIRLFHFILLPGEFFEVPVVGPEFLKLTSVLFNPSGIVFLFCPEPCLLYTSDAADDLLCVDLGGRRLIKKKKNITKKKQIQ